ncbi:winged helix-turn-helix domain-containing protein [Streptomyces reniochalinae]|uniref:Transcriptional regulator n=1 Tax=Streptomyces reniochalinae TaxID=2250578 RepID=A0A367EQR1_9ACTN|nr:transcriptional regulator [Streptomyces reniochalinae]RCG20371.1 transcriptional regulator [Streptomyces reniochalinae]
MAPADFDPVLLDPTRLSIVSLLSGLQWAEFAWVRESVGLSASALSKQITTLGNHGYVDVDKGYVGKRPRTWLNLSEEGRAALETHLAALQRVVEDSRRAAGTYQAKDERPLGHG